MWTNFPYQIVFVFLPFMTKGTQKHLLCWHFMMQDMVASRVSGGDFSNFCYFIHWIISFGCMVYLATTTTTSFKSLQACQCSRSGARTPTAVNVVAIFEWWACQKISLHLQFFDSHTLVNHHFCSVTWFIIFPIVLRCFLLNPGRNCNRKKQFTSWICKHNQICMWIL